MRHTDQLSISLGRVGCPPCSESGVTEIPEGCVVLVRPLVIQISYDLTQRPSTTARSRSCRFRGHVLRRGHALTSRPSGSVIRIGRWGNSQTTAINTENCLATRIPVIFPRCSTSSSKKDVTPRGVPRGVRNIELRAVVAAVTTVLHGSPANPDTSVRIILRIGAVTDFNSVFRWRTPRHLRLRNQRRYEHSGRHKRRPQRRAHQAKNSSSNQVSHL